MTPTSHSNSLKFRLVIINGYQMHDLDWASRSNSWNPTCQVDC
jgi:hypothetical protein